MKAYWEELKRRWEDHKHRNGLTENNKEKWSEKDCAYEKYFAEYIPLEKEEIVNTYNNGFGSNFREIFNYRSWENPRKGFKKNKPSTIALPAIDIEYFEPPEESKKKEKKEK